MLFILTSMQVFAADDILVDTKIVTEDEYSLDSMMTDVINEIEMYSKDAPEVVYKEYSEGTHKYTFYKISKME